MDENQMLVINEMLKTKKSEKLLKESFCMLFDINRDNIISRITIIVISLALSSIVSIKNPVMIMRELSSMMLDISIAIFGIIFTGYAIFQSLLNGRLVTILIMDIKIDKKTNKNMCTLHETNLNFVQLMMQFVVMMFVNMLLKILLTMISEDFCLFSQMMINEILVFILVFIYLYHTMVILWRMISFIFNIYQLFNSHAVAKFLESIENKNDSD